MAEFKLTRDLHRDIDILHDAVDYVAGLANEVHQEAINENEEVSVFIHVMDILKLLRQAQSSAQQMLWEKNKLYK